jgi:putative ABC transport system permease protein
MNTLLLRQSALRRLLRFKGKSVLMGFGIFISVFALILVQSASVGIRDRFEDFIERSYPADTILIVAGSGLMGGAAGRTNLRLSEVQDVVAGLGGVAAWDPVVTAGLRDVRQGGAVTRASLYGHSEHAEEVRGRAVGEGEAFNADHVARRARVALIGTNTSARLFPDQSAVGETIFIDNIPFEILGVLESAGVDPHGGDQDNTVHIPYTTMMDQILRVDFVSGASIVAQDADDVEGMAARLVEQMREQHRIAPGQPDDFSVLTAVEVRKLLDKTFSTFNIFVPLIGALVFVVSGLVILGVMLISIRERTAEIGLRKALGARPADLRLQIVAEVLAVAAVAALAGFLLAAVGLKLLAPLLAQKFGVEGLHLLPGTVVTAILAALLIGMLGALLPAARAARMDPVHALR